MAALNTELLTKVGPGSLMSKMMRQYWIPVGQSSELKAGGAPVRILLLGERLLAFRQANGEIGVIDHVCAHRGASLFYGRNEEGGIRCAYHGWKYNLSGACVDMPNIPGGGPRSGIKLTAYKTAEGSGMFWVYMGDREVPPPLPIFAHHDIEGVFQLRNCNWLQSLEGDIDTSHVGFLHMGAIKLEDLPDGHPSRIRLLQRAPEFEVVQTAWGNMSGAYRDTSDGRFWGLSHYLYPFWTITANDLPLGPPWLARAWVPMDETHTMVITMIDKNWAFPPGLADRAGNVIPGTSFDWGAPIPNSSDWLGRWRTVESIENDHLIDRGLQQISTLVGVEGIVPQDHAITESQGLVQDRTKEHLVSSDAMIVRTRRLLQTTAEQWVHEGIVPPGVDDPETFYGARGGVLPTQGKENFVEVFNRAVQRTATFKSAYDTSASPKEAVALTE